MAFGSALLAGCAGTPWGSPNSSTTKPASGEAKETKPSAAKSSGSEADAQSLKQVMSELQQVGAIDPAAQDKLMADLKQVDPSLWPMVLQTFRAEAAYKRREEQREAARQKQDAGQQVDHDHDHGYMVPDMVPAPDGLAHEAVKREEPAARATSAALPETRFELKSSPSSESIAEKPSPPAPLPSCRPWVHGARQQAGEGGQAAPQPSSLSIVNLDNSLALSPEPAVMSGPDSGATTTASAAEKPSAAGSSDGGLKPTLQQAEKPNEAAATAAEPPSVVAQLTALRGQVSASAPAAGPLADADWQAHLTAAIRSIELESKAGSNRESDVALQARLRMLYLLAGRRDDALRPLPAAPQAAKDYWSSQIYGLSTWMDAEKTPDSGRRAAETKRILGEALSQLGETAPLAVRNLTFCSEVLRFGAFDALKSAEFTPGQKVLLYAEVDNLHIESSAKGYHWAVKVNGQILDNRGNRVTDCGSTAAEEYFQTPRHDFFVSKLYYLPRLAPARYTLQLTVEDTLGHKSGWSSIDFTVKP